MTATINNAALVLSPQASSLGGALTQIMNDPQEVANYATNGIELADIDKRDIGDLVVDHPKLNTEANVGALIWLVSYHQVSLQDVEALFEEYQDTPRYIYLAFEFLAEVGERTANGSTFFGKEELNFGAVEALARLLNLYHQTEQGMDRKISTPEDLSDLVTALGGIAALEDFHVVETLEEKLPDHKE